VFLDERLEGKPLSIGKINRSAKEKEREKKRERKTERGHAVKRSPHDRKIMVPMRAGDRPATTGFALFSLRLREEQNNIPMVHSVN